MNDLFPPALPQVVIICRLLSRLVFQQYAEGGGSIAEYVLFGPTEVGGSMAEETQKKKDFTFFSVIVAGSIFETNWKKTGSMAEEK